MFVFFYLGKGNNFMKVVYFDSLPVGVTIQKDDILIIGTQEANIKKEPA